MKKLLFVTLSIAGFLGIGATLNFLPPNAPVTAYGTFIGSGSGLTNLSASQLTGTLPAGSFPALTGDISTSAGAVATTLKTSPTIVTPTIASFVNATHTHQNAAGGGSLDAAAIASGTVADARLSANVALRSVDFQRLTNSGTKTITFNYTNRVTISDFSTNASFTWDAAANVSPTNYQTAIVYVYNTGGSVITMTPPPGVILLGTANVTNGGYTVVSWAQNGLKNTNGMSLPFK